MECVPPRPRRLGGVLAEPRCDNGNSPMECGRPRPRRLGDGGGGARRRRAITPEDFKVIKGETTLFVLAANLLVAAGEWAGRRVGRDSPSIS